MIINGILSAEESKEKPVVIVCYRCTFINQHDNKYCSKCSYPLKPEAYEEIKSGEDKRMKILEENQKRKDDQINQLMKKQEKFEQLIQSLIDNGELTPSINNIA